MAERSRTQRKRVTLEEARTSERHLGEREAPEAVPQEESERALARAFSVGLPLAGAAAAVLLGSTSGLAPAVLVLAGTALLGTVGFFWASLRTLSGDAPLPEGLSERSFAVRTPAPERKRETLRALKDLEFEHSIGKIDDADYRDLSARYRAIAKTLMRELDEGLAPRRLRAEELVKAYLAKRKLAPSELEESEAPARREATTSVDNVASPRVTCVKCSVSNEPDAAFCKKCGASLAKSAPSAEDKSDASV